MAHIGYDVASDSSAYYPSGRISYVRTELHVAPLVHTPMLAVKLNTCNVYNADVRQRPDWTSEDIPSQTYGETGPLTGQTSAAVLTRCGSVQHVGRLPAVKGAIIYILQYLQHHEYHTPKQPAKHAQRQNMLRSSFCLL